MKKKISQILVYSDPLEPYHLLLLSSAKFEISQFLYENKKEIYEKEFFDQILAECEGLLLACVSLQNDKSTDIVPAAVIGKI